MNSPDYLALLRQANQGNTHHEGTAQTAKTSLRSLCSSTLAQIDPDIPLPTARCEVATRGWILRFTDRDSVEVRFSPVVTHAEAVAAHPDAIAAEPIPEPPGPTPTEAEAAELRTLVNRVADRHDFTAEQRHEALEIALADPTAALDCFGALTVIIPGIQPATVE